MASFEKYVNFRPIVQEYGRLLMADFNLSLEDAAAVFGNLAHECAGFSVLQEVNPIKKGSRGGYGWAQWTGPRRRAYEAYCRKHGFNPAAELSNYKFLFVELRGAESRALAALKQADGLAAKTEAFSATFLRPGIPHMDSRQIWAAQALRVLREGLARPAPTSDHDTKTDRQPQQKESGMNAILKTYIGKVVRHGLTAVAGGLIAKGWLDASTAATITDLVASSLTEIILAGVAGAGGLGWSFWRVGKPRV